MARMIRQKVRDMKNYKIAEVLKEYRKKNDLSVTQVSNILKEHNNYTAPKTIYGWESGHTQPDADTLMFLCKLYKVDDVLESFGYKEKEQKEEDVPEIILTAKELELIENYRKNEEMQSAVDRLLNLEEDD